MQQQEFGAYLIEHIIAAGNYATLYTIQDRPDLILKVLPDDLTEDASFKSRFEATLETTVQLIHPHLLRLYDYGIEETLPYVVMPRLAHSLEDLLKEGKPLSSQKILPILLEIADALDYLHAQGFVHQDVKPSNILFDADGNVYLTDFGLFPLMQETYTLLGKEPTWHLSQYSAPEQVDMRADPTTDIYALGIIAFQCLTGTLPFLNSDEETLAHTITQNAPQRPTRLNSQLPPEVDDVFLRILAKQPSRRFQSAREMVESLQKILTSETEAPAEETTTLKTTRAKRTPLWWARHIGCGLLLAVWFLLMLSPCVFITVLVQGEFTIQLSDRPNHQLRIFNVDTDDSRGFGFSIGNIQRETEEEVCVVTQVRYIMWRGENEPVDYCQCYTRSEQQWIGGAVLDAQCQ